MALTRIYMIPGIGGSTLYLHQLPYGTVWDPSVLGLTFGQLVTHGFEKLIMKPDFTSKFDVSIKPGPLPSFVQPLSSLCYGDAIDALSKDFEVVQLPYDFRFLPSQIQSSMTIDKPGYFVCHSMGCLVAAEIYARLKSEGKEDLARGFFFCGGPFGLNASAEAVKLFADPPFVFSLLAAANIISHSFTAKYFPPTSGLNPDTANVIPPVVLIAILAGWPSISTLIPNEPLELVTEAFYRRLKYGRSVRQSWLDLGAAEKERNLANARSIPPGKIIEIVGTGVPTIPRWNQPADLAGDGVVHNLEALNANGVFAIPQGVHRNLLDDPRVTQIVKLAIQSDFTVQGRLDLSLLPPYGGQWHPKQYELSSDQVGVFVNPTPSQLFDPDP